MADLPNASILKHIVDVHCHPTDAPFISPESMARLQITVCAMSTMQSDQQLVRDLATAYPTKVIPSFGYHPWFAYQISLTKAASKHDHYQKLFLPFSPPKPDHVLAFNKLLPSLPNPIPLHDILLELRSNLEVFPQAMLGEVGLDRTFRIPFDYYAPRRELSPFTVPFDHQLAILEAQLDLAVELSRNVSLHSVKSQLATGDLFTKMKDKHGDKWTAISIDLHSCGLSPETWRDIEERHENIFLSLSTVINGRSENHKALIAACSSNRLLVESDFHDINMCSERTWDMIKTIADVRRWDLEEDWADALDESEWGAVRKLEKNWFAFKAGKHVRTGKKANTS